MKLAPGIKITDHVRLLSLLDEGGMGSVWIAEHLSLDARVAVKFISQELAHRDPEVIDRFRREARVAAKIASPHVVKTFDCGEMVDGTPYIVMELLRGNSLAEWLDLVGPLSPHETAQLVKQTVSVLSLAHELGVIHRDIKPGNLFLLDAGAEMFVKVLDFGIAKQTLLDAPKVITAAGTLMGTPDYMSPERLAKAGHVDEQSDYWSLAVVAYQAMTGCLPFGGDTLPALAAAIINGRFTPPTVVGDHLPASVDAWFAKALAHAPADRFDSGAAMAHALELAVAGESLGRGPSTLASVADLGEAVSGSGSAPAQDQLRLEAPSEATGAPDWVAPLAAPLEDAPPPSSGTLALWTELPAESDDVSRTRWDVLFEGSVAGPVTTKLLMRGLETGSIPRTVEVRKSGSSDWHSIGDVPTLVSAAEARNQGGVLGAYELVPPTPMASVPEDEPRAAGSLRPARPAGRSPRRPWLLYGGALVMLVAAAAAVALMGRSRATTAGSGQPVASALSSSSATMAAAARSCEAERARVIGGAAFGTEVTGWVVELWLGRKGAGLRQHAALRRLVAHERLAPGSGHVLDVVEPGSAHALWSSKGGSRAALGVDTALLQLDGAYVRAFASAAGRRNLERLAARLMAASTADYGALYARCAHRKERDVGAWYGGRTVAAAAAAVLYAAGGFAEPPVIDLRAGADHGLLPSLTERLAGAKEERMKEAVASAGGRLVWGKGQAPLAAIVFGLDGALRATALSRALAELLAEPGGR